MLGLNFSEILLIAVVAFVAIGPKELPVVIRHVAGFIRELRALTRGIRTQMQEVAREAGVDDLWGETGTIIDLEGKPQKAYDVRELKTLEAPRTQEVPPPSRGRLGGGAPDSAPSMDSPPPNPPRKGEGLPPHPLVTHD